MFTHDWIQILKHSPKKINKSKRKLQYICNQSVMFQVTGWKTAGGVDNTMLVLSFVNFAENEKVKKKKIEKIAAAQLQYVCNFSVKFQWYWLKTVTVREVDYKKWSNLCKYCQKNY